MPRPGTVLSTQPEAPTAIHSRALGTLAYIRASIESSSSMDVPGMAGIVMGLIGGLAAAVVSLPRCAPHWLEIWLFAAATALLLGRRSDAWFADRWPSRSGEWADKLNSMPKFVVSSTLKEAKWSNSTIIKGDVVSEVSKLKEQIRGEILVYASYQLVHALLENDLVDELRLVIFPVLLGSGERLFGATSDKMPLRLVDVTTIGDGLTFATYEVVREA